MQNISRPLNQGKSVCQTAESNQQTPRVSCSKFMTLLVNVSLKFKTKILQIHCSVLQLGFQKGRVLEKKGHSAKTKKGTFP